MWVISDEVYDEMVFDGEHAYAAAYGDAEHVVTVFSFSKTYAMTGWRVGYARAPRRVAEAMLKVLEFEISCPPTPSQHAALAALAGDQACVAQMREAYRERRDLAVAMLHEAGLLAGVPRGAFYVLADVSATTRNTADFARALARRPDGVACAPGEAFGAAGRGLLRLSLAAAPEQLGEGIRRIAAALDPNARA
jgi:aspartate/methionine/tyrosine aminotransferase